MITVAMMRITEVVHNCLFVGIGQHVRDGPKTSGNGLELGLQPWAIHLIANTLQYSGIQPSLFGFEVTQLKYYNKKLAQYLIVVV